MLTSFSEPEQSTILIVDDEIDNVSAIGSILRYEGFKTLSAGSGLEALALLTDQTVDLVLLDIVLPDIDGFEVLAQLRAASRTKETAVIFLSGTMRDAPSIEKGFELGVNEYLVKPIEPAELLVRVRSLLRLRYAEKRWRQLNADFISMLVHDLRGPLTAVHAFTRLMNEDTEVTQAARSEMLRLMDNSCNHMLDIINDILDLSKLEADYVRLNITDIDLRKTVNETIGRMKPLALKKSIQVTTEYIDAAQLVKADPRKLEQVMENLLGNAIKFTGQNGAICITVRCVSSPDTMPGSPIGSFPSMLVAVTDNGSGIPEEDQQWLFDKYRQVRNDRFRSEKGTGLGLAICKKIIEAHDGQIWLKSTPDVGTTIYFALPIKDE
ncbi:MAG TPA: hybrid sensor histidine kinase/response regulator [Bacteroidota bacterium]|nr:hybrid sensor histidine kinase/response regulator [Bacteroidota bacterium]